MHLITPDRWPAVLEKHLQDAKKPLIVVLGPTASGKTAFSVRLAKWMEANGGARGEIINADSRQLYRHLDIGTAKVTEQEKDGVSHHLFGVLDPAEEVTIAKYKDMAVKMIDEVHARGNVPILVGGSMLYISAVIDGLEPPAPVDKALREKLEAAYDADKGEALYAKLQEIDPETAAAFHRNNRPYLVRAMAMYEASGIAPSAQKQKFDCPYDLLLFGMYWDRKSLTDRIKARTPLLLKAGWVEEVMGLRKMGYDKNTPAMKSHGYREVLEAIERKEKATGIGDWRLEIGESKLVDEVSQDLELIETIDMKTRQYAKRQMTWWKHDERIQWVEMSA